MTTAAAAHSSAAAPPLRRALHYIEAHLEDRLTAERLSRVSGYSKYHFHRQFVAAYGVTPSRYIQLCRLKRASYELAYRPLKSITEIAIDSQYEGPQAFSRAFKKAFKQRPSEFRTAPNWRAWDDIIGPLRDLRSAHLGACPELAAISIAELPETQLAALPYYGPPRLIGDALRHLLAWRTQSLRRRPTRMLDLIYESSAPREAELTRIDLAFSTAEAIESNPFGVIRRIVPAGRFAVLRHIGTNELLPQAINFLQRIWLPASGEKRRNAPICIERLRTLADVAESECVTDICLPLEPKL